MQRIARAALRAAAVRGIARRTCAAAAPPPKNEGSAKDEAKAGAKAEPQEGVEAQEGKAVSKDVREPVDDALGKAGPGVETATHTADGYEKFHPDKVEMKKPPSYYYKLSFREKLGGRLFKFCTWLFFLSYIYLTYLNNRENQLIESRFKGIRAER